MAKKMVSWDDVAGTLPAVVQADLDGITDAKIVAERGTERANQTATFAPKGRVFNVRAYGATGDGTTDDTAAIQAALDAAKMASAKRGGTVLIPAGTYLVSVPLKFYVGVSIIGEGWSLDATYYNNTTLLASPGFVGSAILLQDADGQTVSDPTPRPDRSWHWGTIERILFKGNGITGPHGLDPGWCGEASTIRNVSCVLCNSGIYLSNVQASATLENVSMFSCNIGLNCDALMASTVRVFGLSGDNNTSILRVKGARSSNVTIFSLKTEGYIAGSNDPAIDVVDLLGGALTIVGGFANTSSARTRCIRVTQPAGGTALPRIFLAGFDCSSLYANLLVDATGTVIPVGAGLGYPVISYNANLFTRGEGALGTGYARAITGLTSTGATASLVGTTGSNGANHFAGPGANGGKLVSSDGLATAMQWSYNGNNNAWAMSGKTPIATPTLPVAAVDPATTMSLLNAMRTILIDRGVSN